VCATGASSGTGRAVAEHLGSLGAIVFSMGRTDVAVVDLTDSHRLQSWIQGAADAAGRLDVLVDNAGFGRADETNTDGDTSFWKEMLAVDALALG
jgi:NADP-dependent 3-hydroxy acid dehydrogenase YdfG